MDISIGDATAAIRRVTGDGIVRAAGNTSNGRSSPVEWPLPTADLIIGRAQELRWADDDPDGYRLHVLTAGGRRYRLAAAEG